MAGAIVAVQATVVRQ